MVPDPLQEYVPPRFRMTPVRTFSRSREPSRHLARACWIIVSEHRNLYGSLPTGLYFNKALSLLHRRLGDAGHDFSLPHCWYLYGDEVARDWLPSKVAWDNDVTTYVAWIGNEPPRPSDSLGEAMAVRLDEILREFESQQIEDMVDKVYSYAPFEFQRAYRQVRRAGFEAMQSSLDEESLANLLSALISKASKEFPHGEFPSASFYSRCAFTAALKTLENDASTMQFTREVLEKLWAYWCYHLRLHDKAHENIPESTLNIWRAELRPQERSYAVVFQSHLERMLLVAPELREDELFTPWLAKLDRTDAQASADIAHWSRVLKGIDEFVQSEKS